MLGQTGKIVSPNGFRRGLKKPLIEPHRIRAPFLLHAAAATAAKPIDLRTTGVIAAVKDQGDVGSCTGHSSSGATESQFALQGDPLGFIPSEDTLYKGARSIERAAANPSTPIAQLPPLDDSGANTEDIESFMAIYGVAPRWRATTPDGRNSDCATDTCNTNLDLAAEESARVLLVPGPYAIDPSSSSSETLVQAALSSRICVRVDAFVDMVFEDWTKGAAPIPKPNDQDPDGGGHAIYIVGWDTYSAGAVYIIRNSWSESWGDGGDCLVSSAWIRASWALYPWTVRRAAPAAKAA